MIEIDKTRQLLYAVLDGEVQWVFHTSTGTEEPYPYPEGFTAMADTPPLHGYHAAHPPASHGCARVTFDVMDFIWANDMPMASTVLVYGETPD